MIPNCFSVYPPKLLINKYLYIYLHIYDTVTLHQFSKISLI